jgi:hypothetical protein
VNEPLAEEATMTGTWAAVGLAVAALLGSQGCAGVGMALLSAGVGTATGHSVSYTLESIGYKTFTTPVESLEAAILKALKRMDIEVKGREQTDGGLKITAKAGDRDIDIELDRLTSQTARMRVDASVNWIFRDRATAAEIITQTARVLDDQARLAQAAQPAARGVAAPRAPAARPVIKAAPVSAAATAR